MTLENITSDDLTIKYNGIEYSLGAKATKDFPEDVGFYWKNKIHQFLKVVKTIKPEVTTPKTDAPVVTASKEDAKPNK